MAMLWLNCIFCIYTSFLCYSFYFTCINLLSVSSSAPKNIWATYANLWSGFLSLYSPWSGDAPDCHLKGQASMPCAGQSHSHPSAPPNNPPLHPLGEFQLCAWKPPYVVTLACDHILWTSQRNNKVMYKSSIYILHMLYIQSEMVSIMYYCFAAK